MLSNIVFLSDANLINMVKIIGILTTYHIHFKVV